MRFLPAARRGPTIKLFHFATLSRIQFKLWNGLRTNRARIADSTSLPLRSPQHLALARSISTRSSLQRSHKRRFSDEILKNGARPESNQKWERVNRIRGSIISGDA